MLQAVLLITLFTLLEVCQYMLTCCLIRQGMPVMHCPEFFMLPIFGRRSAITGPFGVIIRYCYLSHEHLSNFINHEKIHHVQWWECLIVLYPIIFLIEFAIYSIIFGDLDKGYAYTAFEQEAYRFQDDPTYLKRRKPYAWLIFIVIKKRVWEDDPDILSGNFAKAHLRHMQMEEGLAM